MENNKKHDVWFDTIYNANIIDLCDFLDIDLTKENKEYRGVEHDSLVISPNLNAYSWNSRGIKGRGGWAFVKDYVLDDHDNHLSKRELVQQMKTLGQQLEKNNVNQFDPLQVPTEKKQPYVYPQDHIVDNIEQAKSYLNKERKIDNRLIDWLHNRGLLDQDKLDNAVFVERDLFTNKIVGAVKQGTHIDYQKYGKRGTTKRIDKNSEPYSAWHFSTGIPANVRFFESPIDAMSYYQLTPSTFQDTIFVSMNGLKKEIVSKYLTEVDSLLATKYHSGIQTIALAVDNDAAGKQFADEQSKYQFTNNMGKTVSIWESLPRKNIGKDWNDVLKAYYAAKEINRQKNRENKQQITGKKLEPHPTTNSQQSEASLKPIDIAKDKSDSKDIVKTSMSDLMKDVNNYFVEPQKTLELLNFLSNFHDYSFRNRILIRRQREGALAVASFTKYRQMGYSVKKGEKGIKILVPFKSETFMRNKSKVPVKYATTAEKNKIKKGQIFVYKELRFTHGNVFDVTQTNMPKEKYPEMYPNRHLDFDINNPIDKTKLDQQLDKFAQKLGYSVNRTLSEADYSNTFGIAKGVTVPEKKAIYLNPSNTGSEMTTTLMHELGHAQLHGLPGSKTKDLSRPLKELQAQMTSYLVAKNYGIDTRDYTVDYIAGWTDNGKKLDQLNPEVQSKILSNTTKAADRMINFIEEQEPKVEIVKEHEKQTEEKQPMSQKQLAAMYAKQQNPVQDEGLELG